MLLRGECIELLRQMPDNSVDAIVTDPPYGIEFMGKEWDSPAKLGEQMMPPTANSVMRSEMPVFRRVPQSTWVAFQKWCEEWSVECLRVLKPGGHMLAFSSARTYHRLACAVEDAGFEVRDQIMWLYGSGFPKSHNISKAIDKKAGAKREVVGSRPLTGNGKTMRSGFHQPDGTGAGETEKQDTFEFTAPATDEAKKWEGWGTALKPAHEPIVVARKPLTGTVANNVLEWGTGALNIDASRVGTDGGTTRSHQEPYGEGGRADQGGTQPWRTGHEITELNAGRWPANVIHDGSDEVLAGFPTTGSARPARIGKKGGNKGALGNFGGSTPDADGMWPADTGGSAARFFYCAKASKSERNAGLDGLPERERGQQYGLVAGGQTLQQTPHKNAPTQNFHPTVKPIALMRYLINLVTPPGGTVLDPFLGSGTTACAAVLDGFQWIGCEMTEDYWPIIEARVAWAEAERSKQQESLF